MKLGFLTQLTEEECRLAASIGYDCIEAHGKWSPDELKGAPQRKAAAAAVKGMLARTGVSISAIALYRAGAYDVKERIALYSAYIKLCRELGVGVITAMSASDPTKSLADNLDAFEKVFKKVGPEAEDAGVKIAFENWPGLTSGFPPIGTINFGYAPQIWEQMFNRVPCKAIGLEFDPSHLVWQGIDYAAALKRFATRVHHVHAKDTEIFQDRLSANGFFSGGWWRYRLPGYGCVNWHNFTSILKENGYEGGVAVEHEDPVFSGPRRAEGLKKAHDYLRPMM